MATVAQLNTYMDSATALIAAESWSAALTQLFAAKACLSGLADGGAGSTYMRWDRNAIDSLIDEIKAKADASIGSSSTTGLGGGIQFSNVKYVQAGAGCED